MATFGTGFGFGQNKPAFGTPQPQAPAGGGLFGSGFGTPAPAAGSAPAFSFSTPAPAAAPASFGTPQPAASTPAFGFGTPVGANSSPAFGAPGATGLFGAPAASSQPAAGTFGAPASTGTTFGFGFGASSAAASAPGTTPSLFGAGASQPATGGLFGASAPAFGARSPAPSTFGGFGSTFSAPATTTGTAGAIVPAFNTQPGTLNLSTPGATALQAQQSDAAVKEITELKAAYTPGSQAFKFQYLFLNVVDNPAQRVKPQGIDEMRWRQAMAAAGGPDNPDRLWPVAASGFSDLLARSAAQASALEENSNRLKSLNDLAAKLSKKHSTELKQRAQDIQKRHVELSHRLLHAWRLLDGLESRLASRIGYRGDEARAQELALSKQLALVEPEVSATSATGLPRRLEAVASAARQRAGGAALGASLSQAKLDERSSAQLLAVLKDHAAGVSKLQQLLKRDALDVEIMRKEQEEAAGARGRLLLD